MVRMLSQEMCHRYKWAVPCGQKVGICIKHSAVSSFGSSLDNCSASWLRVQSLPLPNGAFVMEQYISRVA